VLYGAGTTKAAEKELKKLDKKAAFVAVEPGVNTRAAVTFGLNNGFKPSVAKLLFVLLGEENGDDKDRLEKVPEDAFVVVQASFLSALTDKAEVVFPMAIWSERTGTLTNTEGRVQEVNKAVEPKGEARPDWEIIMLLADTLGKKMTASFAEISAQATKELK
jgi:NADH dehydrogenase/NADH:ubiquinone oxidoreductase subunit G